MLVRFGLADGTQMTLTEIGKHFCVTRERIRQVTLAFFTLFHTSQDEFPFWSTRGVVPIKKWYQLKNDTLISVSSPPLYR